MAIKRKSKEPVRVSLPRRAKRHLEFRTIQPTNPTNPKNSTHIDNLPDEMLIQIFSHLSPKVLCSNVRPVCKRWKELSMTSTLWKKIEVDNEVPTQILSEWIKSANFLKSFSMQNRNDANIITTELSKNSKLLETVKIQNCWGSPEKCIIQSKPLCHLVTRCRKLHSFNFCQSRILSRKFFRLISTDKHNGGIMKKCNYVGPISATQMEAFFRALCNCEVHDLAIIGNRNFTRRLKLCDIIRHIKECQNPRPILNMIWENLNWPRIWEITV